MRRPFLRKETGEFRPARLLLDPGMAPGDLCPLMNRMVLRPLHLIPTAGIDLMRPAHYYYEKSPAFSLRY
uniref:Uncharacterized protein n=1 Tax=Cajanus cajan TaxID=3821 RepID=A0A151QSM8_CAJCA|nr:hypothetical protein KK1_045899 [Cajanus cajan]